MAIQQVSRITVRKGLAEDLPQPLAGAEMGWAVDQRRLYIGNGTLADGAPIVGNTEILTEFSDLFEYSSAYTYVGQAAGYTVQTGATAGAPISQSLQARLDSYAVVTDFGAVGDGVTDDTAAINRALFQLYCVQANPQIRRSLFFPAGEYLVTDTVLIPPYARLYGEGADSSIIKFSISPWAANTAYNQAGILVENSGSYYRNKIPVPASGIAITDTNYWDPETLPAYVVRTADSQQQIGNNIGVNGATVPTNVSVTNMGWHTTVAVAGGHDIVLLEKVARASWQECSFKGPLTTATLTTAVNDLAGVRFISTSSLPCEAVTFDRCTFSGLTYGVNTEYLTKGVTLRDGQFTTLYQGVILGGTVILGGPQGFRIVGNTFDEIYAEGVIIDDCSLNGTAYNTFLGVGNRFAPAPQTQGTSSPVMTINADNNVSVGDVFSRSDEDANNKNPRILLFNQSSTPQTVPASIAFTNGRTTQFGAYTRYSGLQTYVEDGTTVELVGPSGVIEMNSGGLLPNGNPRAFAIDYTILRQSTPLVATRTGRLIVIPSDDGDSAGADGVTWTDDFVENTQTDMQFVVSGTDGDPVQVEISAEATGQDGTIYWSLNYLA